MSRREIADPRAQLSALQAKLTGWLVNEAYPRWAQYGIDPQNGGFSEALGQDGLGLFHPRRARVHPRQVYAFGQALALGWRGDAGGVVSRGVGDFTPPIQRHDRLVRSLGAVHGNGLGPRRL